MIQAASDFGGLEKMIKGLDEVRRKNRGDDLESVFKEDRGKKLYNLETVGQEDLFKSVEQEDLETVGKEDSSPPNSPDPPNPPRRIQITFDQ